MPPVPPIPASPELELLEDDVDPVCWDEPPEQADVAKAKANEATIGKKKEERVFMMVIVATWGLGRQGNNFVEFR